MPRAQGGVNLCNLPTGAKSYGLRKGGRDLGTCGHVSNCVSPPTFLSVHYSQSCDKGARPEDLVS